MTPDRWERAKSIFGAAISMEPGRRERYVREAAGDDADVCAEVLSLLREDSVHSFLNPITTAEAPGQAASATPPILPTRPVLVKERYQVEREIGRGGLGVVYLARDMALHNRPVVIKALQAGMNSPYITSKFALEAKALSMIDHPGVVGALDSGVLSDGRPFLVMQYVEGKPLLQSIPNEGVPLGRAASLLSQIGRALGAAHAKGILHRDLKPANIMVQNLDNGVEHVRLIDFGIASIHEATGGETGTCAVGTLSYMAPEQLRGRVSKATDIYAMGVIAYELVTGRRPFVADTDLDLHDQQKAGVRVKPSLLQPALRPEAERLILQGLAFEPKHRPQDAAAFGEELSRYLTPTLDPPRRRTSRGLIGAGIAGAVVLVAAAGVWWGMHSTKAPQPQQQSASVATPVPAGPVAPSAKSDPPARSAVPTVQPPKRKTEPAPKKPDSAAKLPPPRAVLPADEYGGALRGVLRWNGRLAPGEILTIQGGKSSTGSLEDDLPRRPIRVGPEGRGGPDLLALQVSVVEEPSELNHWDRLVLRNDSSVPVEVISIGWAVIR